MPERLPKGKHKIEKVMREHKAGTLRSSSGQKVTSRKQAVAIGLSEQREFEKRHRRNMRSRVSS